MGSTDFRQRWLGADVRTAFEDAKAQARHEWGHNGYTGTIAEKGEYIVLPGAVRTEAEANDLADQYIQERTTSRYTDKYGPCGAIAIKTPERIVKLEDVSGFATELVDAATKAVTERGLLADGETVVNAELQMYSYNEHSRDRRRPFHSGRMQVTITKTPQAIEKQSTPDGWLFFGTAPE